MSDMKQIARRAVACDGWRWMRGMLCLTDDDGYASRIIHVGLSGRTSETADSYVDGGVICRSYIKDDALPDLDDPATLGCLLELVRRTVGDNWATDVSKNDPCWLEAEALVRVLEAAGTKGRHPEPDVDLFVQKAALEKSAQKLTE